MTNLKAGDRIELVLMPNDPAPIEPGTCGTVTNVSGPHRLGRGEPTFTQVSVKWDSGRTLSLVLPPDEVRLVGVERNYEALLAGSAALTQDVDDAHVEIEKLQALLRRAEERLMVSEGDARYETNNIALAQEIAAALQESAK